MLTRIKRWLNRNQPSPFPTVPLPPPEELLQTLDKENYVLARMLVTYYDDDLDCHVGCLISSLTHLKGSVYGCFTSIYPEVEEPYNLEAGFEGWYTTGDTSSPYYQYGQRVAELAGLNA